MIRSRASVLASLVTLLLVVTAPSSAASDTDGTLLGRAPVALDQDARRALTERRPAVLRLLAQISLEEIVYRSDGLRVKGYLAMPKDVDPSEPLPSVIFNRGGNREFGALSDVRAASILAPLAARGYVVVASQYRGNGGGEGTEEFGGAEIADVLALLPLLDALPEADGTRIGMYGWSRGGLMTYLALARTDRIRAAIVGAGVSDSFASVADRPALEERVYAELVPGWPETREQALHDRSPIRWADRLHKRTPILLLHGSSDWRVHPSQALGMATALYEARHPFRFVFLEGGDHGLTEHRAEVDRLVAHWLDHYVRDRAPLPDLEPHGR